jgi:hypothetical protein
VATYLVSYDLNRPNGENAYPNLINALVRDGAVRILYSEWLVPSNQNGGAVRDRYLQHMDSNDGIFVTAVTDWAFANIQSQQAAQKLLP